MINRDLMKTLSVSISQGSPGTSGLKNMSDKIGRRTSCEAAPGQYTLMISVPLKLCVISN